MDASDVGSFGTLSLIRCLPTESVVTSYPIDDEELTIGRDQSCSLRLYYPAVSALHAKITFVERKAFLVVLGTNGVLLDDIPLFPTAPGPTTVPLQNNSVVEIHKKRFRFTYPPKHLRPSLINTPTRATPTASRRPLRLSMIASAHVFTPRPSQDPLENLRVLQTPFRTPFSREEEEIVLVHSNTPRVVEEDKDLIILDEVEPEPMPLFPLARPVMPQYPVTPVRRPRPSLHRAVLIRSAQRVAIQREIQLEEEQDEDEVEETIAAIPEETDDGIEEIPPPEGHQQVSGWRKSLDLVKDGFGWAFRGLSVEPKEEEEEPTLDEELEEIPDHPVGTENESDPESEGEVDNEQENDYTPSGEPSRPLGHFMTPQFTRIASKPRLSLGGAALESGPRRVRVVPPWKVSEIDVPVAIKEEDRNAVSGTPTMPPSTPRSPVKREKLTEQEREAIRARRRSAVATPDNFFKGQTPGSRRTLFPALAPLPSPSFVQREEPSSTSSGSDVKADDKEDTAVLLARMKQMVEGVKQRQSQGRQSLSLSPRKREQGFSLLAPNHASALLPSRILIEEDADDTPEDPLMEDTQSGSGSSLLPAHPATPHFTAPVQLPSRPPVEVRTPAPEVVREMFRVRPQEVSDTPQTSETNHTQQEEKDEQDDSVEAPARPGRGKKTPRTKNARQTPVPQSAPPKSTRASSQAIEEEPERGPGGRRMRARTADGAVGQIPRPTRGKTAKTTTPEPQEEDVEEQETQPAAPARGTRRTRQTTDSSTSSHAEDTDTKPARRTRVKTPTVGAGSTTKKAGTTRRGARTKPIEVTEEDDEDDPLDSISRDRVPTDEVPQSVPAPRARRGGRKAQVKEEEGEESVPAATSETGTRATRARRTPVPATTGRAGARTRTATANADSAIPENKENTPEASVEEDEEEAKMPGSRARGGKRGARTSERSTPAESSEPGTSAVPAPKTRRTRGTKG